MMTDQHMATETEKKEEPIKGKEGFDILGKEAMMRSKDSNKIPVHKSTVEGFEPYDDEFTSYSMF